MSAKPNPTLCSAWQSNVTPCLHSGVLDAGDVNEIQIGENTNIQDGVIIHVAKNNAAGASLPTTIGNNVTIGERSLLIRGGIMSPCPGVI